MNPPPLQKGDRGRIPPGCAAMSGSFPTGPPRSADQGGKDGDFSCRIPESRVPNPFLQAVPTIL
jgi:hypothetical protein